MVFMITLPKNTKNDKSSVEKVEAEEVRFSRTERSVAQRTENGKEFPTEIPGFACGPYFIVSLACWRI